MPGASAACAELKIMHHYLRYVLILLLLAPALPAEANSDDPGTSAPLEPAAVDGETLNPEQLEALREAAELEESLRFQTGRVTLRLPRGGEALAELNTGSRLRYLDAKDTDRVLQAWQNLPDPNTLGMIMSTELGPFDPGNWAVVLTYVEDGHIEDEDAEDLDADDLLDELRKMAEENNAVRRTKHLPTLEITGWAESPRYEAATRQLIWARNLHSSDGLRSLNYDVRILTRKGYLSLNALAVPEQIATVKREVAVLIDAIELSRGQRYEDFDPEFDQVAAYGVGALILGKVASKAGLFAGLGVLLLKMKKLLVLGAVGLVALAKRLFGGAPEIGAEEK
ncbi:MAG: DUF2167 domain-containing protein [Myxococcota bacterium]